MERSIFYCSTFHRFVRSLSVLAIGTYNHFFQRLVSGKNPWQCVFELVADAVRQKTHAARAGAMILSKPSGMAGHGSFPMKVVGSPMTNNLVRTNHTDFYHVSTHIHIFISVI